MITIQPDDHAAAWGLAEVKRRQHDIEQSKKMLEEIIQKHPAFFPALITLAYIKYSTMEFEQAVKLGYAVIKGGEKNVDLSNYTRAHLIIAGAKGMIAYYGGPLSKLINGTGILPMLKDAQSMQPDSPGVWFGLGSFYSLAPPIVGGDIDKGIGYLQRVTQADPGFADAYVRLGQIYRIKGDNQKYEELLAKALQIDPKNELALDVQSGRCKFICTPAKNE
jgi:tetratricopeptide (TPR) repeat protein